MREFVGGPSRCSAVRRTPPPIAWAHAPAHPLCAHLNLTSPFVGARKRQGPPCSEWRAGRGSNDDTANVNQISSGTSLMASKGIGCTSGKHPLELEPALCLLLMLTSGFHPSAAGYGPNQPDVSIWWLQELGGQLLHGQLIDMTLLLVVHAAALGSTAERGMEAVQRRFGDVTRLGRLCSMRTMLLSLTGSCAPLHEALSMIGGSIVAYSAICVCACAVVVVALPLWRTRWVARL